MMMADVNLLTVIKIIDILYKLTFFYKKILMIKSRKLWYLSNTKYIF